MRTITLEEHYATEAFMEGPGRELKAQAEAARDHPRVAAGYDKLIEQLCDLGDAYRAGTWRPQPTSYGSSSAGRSTATRHRTRGRAHG